MNEPMTVALLFALIGAVFIGLGVPLLQERVPPNPWYGFRTPKTCSDEKIWYAANYVCGRDLIIAGAIVVSSALVMLAVASKVDPALLRATLLSVLIFSVVGMVVNGFRELRKM